MNPTNVYLLGVARFQLNREDFLMIGACFLGACEKRYQQRKQTGDMRRQFVGIFCTDGSMNAFKLWFLWWKL